MNKNWKTQLAFWIATFSYPYSLYQKYDSSVLYITAGVFLVSMTLFMARGDKAGALLDAVTEHIKSKKG